MVPIEVCEVSINLDFCACTVARRGLVICNSMVSKTALLMASTSLVPEMEFIDTLLEVLHQPYSFCFPKRNFGKKKTEERSCLGNWFQTWSLLNRGQGPMHCHLCLKAIKLKHIAVKSGDFDGFVS